MAYTNVERALENVIAELPNYTKGENLSRGDPRIIGKGSHESYIILTMGGFPSRRPTAAPRRITTGWNIQLLLLVLFKTDLAEVHADVVARRQEIIDKIDSKPTLNFTPHVVNAIVSSGGEPERWRGESRNYWIQRMTVSITENVYVAIADA